MFNLHVDFDQNIPQYVCTQCGRCTSAIARSMCIYKSRGCCWYFPKFTLVDIHRMVKSIEGLQTLKAIRTNPLSVVYNYYIHAKGYFDKAGYNEFMKNKAVFGVDDEKDYTTLFRACPFVKDGKGCTLPPRYRTYVCNFFICDEIVEQVCSNDLFKIYIDERSSYSRWIDWENISLEHVLREYGVNLVDDFDAAVKILQDQPLDIYEFPNLRQIEIIDYWSQGA